MLDAHLNVGALLSSSADDLYPGGSFSGYMRNWKNQLAENSRRRRLLMAGRNADPLTRCRESRRSVRRLQQQQSLAPSGSGASSIYYAEKFITVSGKEYGYQLAVDRTNGIDRTYRNAKVSMHAQLTHS